MTIADIVAASDHVLLTFDGPVCTIFGGHVTDGDVADRLKTLIGTDPPREVRASGDPFEVLRYAASCGPRTGQVVEAQLRRLETEAAASAPETPGATETLKRLTESGYTVTIVSNHSLTAIRSYLTLHDLTGYIRGIAARTGSDLALLKPSPHLVKAAIRGRGTTPDRCVFVGTSPADLAAANAAGVTAIAYTDPTKPPGFRIPQAAAVITSMTELSGDEHQAVRSVWRRGESNP